MFWASLVFQIRLTRPQNLLIRETHHLTNFKTTVKPRKDVSCTAGSAALKASHTPPTVAVPSDPPRVHINQPKAFACDLTQYRLVYRYHHYERTYLPLLHSTCAATHVRFHVQSQLLLSDLTQIRMLRQIFVKPPNISGSRVVTCRDTHTHTEK
jgi:hypothetical protein